MALRRARRRFRPTGAAGLRARLAQTAYHARVVLRAPWIVAFAGACTACGAAIPQSNSAKLGEALAFAAVAAATQVAEAAAEQHARNAAPVTQPGLTVSSQCDNDDQYACASVTAGAPPAPPPDPEMTVDDAREYVLGYINGVRKLNGVAPVVRDEALDAFAQAGSAELALDHLARRHFVDRESDLGARSAEIQGPSDGSRPGALEDQIAAVLLDAMREGPGGPRRATLLGPDWRRLGVGITRTAGRTYFTADLAE